jgi:DNA-binding transcriptional regulator YhcF (GntR family)
MSDTEQTGPRFTKVYDRGWARVESLLTLKGGPTVGRLWLLIVKHCGHDNALVASLETLADALGVDERTVRRAIKFLETSQALVVVKVGTARAFVLNDAEVWKTYEDHHQFCAFRSKVLVGFKENAGLRARLTHLQAQASLPLDGEAVEAA